MGNTQRSCSRAAEGVTADAAGIISATIARQVAHQYLLVQIMSTIFAVTNIGRLWQR